MAADNAAVYSLTGPAVRVDGVDQHHAMWYELPDELWEAILNFCYDDLKRISLVCKRFLSLSNRILTHWFICPHDAIPLARLYSRFTLIKKIYLWDPDPNLDATITQLAQSNLPLRSLSLSHQTHFPKDAMALIGSNMSKTLRSLSCTYFLAMDDDDLAVVAQYFSYLRKFDVQYSSNSSNADDFDESSQKMDRCITDAGIWEISSKLKSLVSVNIAYLDNLSHRSFEYLAANCTSLRKLRSDFNGFNCNVCLDLFPSLSRLFSLELYGKKISKGAIVHLSQAKLKVKKLRLIYYQVTNDINGALFCQFLKSLQCISRLDLDSVLFPSDLTAIDFTSCIPNLQEINLYDNPWSKYSFPPATLFHLLKNCKFLKGIHICGNLETRKQDWLTITGQRTLERLNLEFCEDLSDEILMRIVSICPNLVSLSIRESSHISEEGIKAFLIQYTKFMFLEVEGCNSVKSFRIENF